MKDPIAVFVGRRQGAVVAAAVLALTTLAACEVRIGRVTMPGSSGHPTRVARSVDPRLVDVVSTLGYLDARSAGTGVVLTASGEVLTNNHVIAGATSVMVTDVGNGRTYRATVIGYDESGDIAILRLRGATGLRALTMRASKATIGERVLALGNAGGVGGVPAQARGRITGLGQAIVARDMLAGTAEHLTGLIRTNVHLLPGDSGGPLLDSAGRLIGIDTAASARFLMPGSTTAFAIPVGRALRIARQIEAGKPSAAVHIGPTGFLGVRLEPASAAGLGAHAGALVASVIPGLPAAKSGLAARDLIVAAAGRPVSSPSDIAAILVPHHPGDKIMLRWEDPNGQVHTATITLARGPAA
jgi:S1-C subfamily serine protease